MHCIKNILNPNNSVYRFFGTGHLAFTITDRKYQYHHFKDIQNYADLIQMEDFKKVTTDLAEFFVNHNKMDRHST